MRAVLEIADYAAPYKGNFLASLDALARSFRADGIQTVFLFPYRAGERAWCDALRRDYPVYLLPPDGKAASVLRTIRRAYDVRVVHTHFIDKSVYIPLRTVCGDIPHVFHAHSLPKFPENDPALFLRRGLLHAQKILCVSEPVAEAYTKRGFRGCETIPNGVAFSRLDEGDAAPLPRPLALCFGYDFRIKGVDTALTAFERYDTAHTFTLGICAAGHVPQAEQAVCARYGEIPAWVRILPGREDVGAYYRSADVLVSASRQEGMPYAVLEAAYCGVPLALSGIAPHRSLALPGAVYFPPEDPEALFHAVRQAVRQTDTQTCKDYVYKRFSLERWTQDVRARLLPREDVTE